MTETAPLESAALPSGIRSRFVHDINGLRMHVLEAGFEGRGRPCVLLLHGFPELAYSWRKVMVPLASAGFHVVAPDQRGYGRTTGWDADYDGDLNSFRLLNLVRDALGLVSALGHHCVAAVVGHDFGASVAAWCALVRPDVFRSVVLMSAPFAGPPALPFATAGDAPRGRGTSASADDIHAALAKLDRPRKHYQWYYSTRAANADMRDCPQGVHAFLRAYFHYKSADWSRNKPFRLKSWTAGELAKMPTYYIMDLDKDMAATVAPEMPSAAEIAACRWLPESELGVYSAEYVRTGFQGGLQWYRCRTGGTQSAELQLFAGRTIDVPSMFIAGKSDWGIYQVPGSIERMQASACTRMQGCHLIDGAGHWVQQEQPEQVSDLLTPFLRQHAGRMSAA
jgi:pimeloyl-ACP methyl ester carboxylesterase